LGAAAGNGADQTPDSIREDALSALLNFGYQKSPAEKAIATAIQDGGEISVEAILRRSLRSLSKG
jgi:Holliday junction resolvasome RuvABC DNA-binding subunit